MARRRKTQPGVSFFAFQDIITAVVGIFILITIILVLELVQRVEAAASGGAGLDTKPVAEAIEALEKEVQRLRQAVEEQASEQADVAKINVFNRDEILANLRSRASSANARVAAYRKKIRELELRREKAASERERLLSEAAGLQDERARSDRLAAQLQAVQQQIRKIDQKQARIYRDKVPDGRHVVLVTLTGNQITVRDAAAKSVRSWSGSRRLDEMRRWLEATDLPARQLFLRIKPGGAADLTALLGALEENGARYGYTVVGEDDSAALGFEVEDAP